MSRIRVRALVPDLMDRSRLSAATSSIDADVAFVRRPEDLAAADADVVVVDLSRPGVLDVLASVSARTVGFGAHVDGDTLRAARAAGCDVVLARSAFFADVVRWLT